MGSLSLARTCSSCTCRAAARASCTRSASPVLNSEPSRRYPDVWCSTIASVASSASSLVSCSKRRTCSRHRCMYSPTRNVRTAGLGNPGSSRPRISATTPLSCSIVHWGRSLRTAALNASVRARNRAYMRRAGVPWRRGEPYSPLMALWMSDEMRWTMARRARRALSGVWGGVSPSCSRSCAVFSSRSETSLRSCGIDSLILSTRILVKFFARFSTPKSDLSILPKKGWAIKYDCSRVLASERLTPSSICFWLRFLTMM
mmetsp:Transcript_21704/g.45609  ORF Transcript_21704/g.45609 Transcript_21704/m.45609 type:complete len:259 (+) Transcript_21704:690-1466(+)